MALTMEQLRRNTQSKDVDILYVCVLTVSCFGRENLGNFLLGVLELPKLI